MTMKVIAFLLITAGTIGATVGVARTVPSVPGWRSAWQLQEPLTVLSLATMLVGIAMQRRAHGDRKTSHLTSGNVQRACAALNRLQIAANQLESSFHHHDLDSLHRTLEEIVTDPLAEFVANSAAISHRYGIGDYAVVMSAFSTAERYLNRAWSASADGYWHEAVEYLHRASKPLAEARASLARITGSP
jgi:hypothetical protein